MSDKLEKKDIDNSAIDWNEHAEYWDEFKDAKLYTEKAFKAIQSKTGIEGKTILDFGCGTGLMIDKTTSAAKQIVALDPAEKMIEVLNTKNYKNVKTIVAELSDHTINHNPDLQCKFDLILAVSVCAFLPNYQEVLSLIKSLLKPDGIFIQLDWLKAEKDEEFGLNETFIQKNFNAVGLKVDALEIPFYFKEHEEKMDVLMAVGKL